MVDLSKFSFPRKAPIHQNPSTDNIEIQLIPEYLLGTKKRECVTVRPGEPFRVEETIEDISLRFEWGFPSGYAPFDVDASIALLSKETQSMGFVWWDNPSAGNDSVHFLSGDNTDGTPGGESIQLRLKKIPGTVQYLAAAVSVYSKDHDMRNLDSITIHGIDSMSTDPLFKYQLPVTVTSKSLIVGCFIRANKEWEFRPLCDPVLSRTVAEILHEPENLTNIRGVSATPKVRRRVTLKPIEGKNLTPMDFSLLSKRSDPYLKIFVDDRVTTSEIIYSTLNPKFVCPSVSLGEASESTLKVVEIQCWDHDKLTDDDNMGIIRFCIGGLMSKVKPGHNQISFKLHPTEEHINEKIEITGDIICDVIVEEFF